MDSTESSILLSPGEFSVFKQQVTAIFPNLICSEQECFTDNINVTCSNFTSKFPSLGLQLGSQVYHMPSSAYCLDYAIGGLVVLAVGQSTNGYVLGTTFLRNFEAVLNLADTSITLAVSPYAPVGVDIKAAPVAPLINWSPYGIPWYFWLEIAIAIALIVILILITCLRCRHSSRNIVQLNANGEEIEVQLSDEEEKVSPTFNQKLALP